MENKEKQLKIFGMVLEVRDTLFLSIQYAQSLEEAINQAKLEFNRINPAVPGFDNSLLGFKVGLYTFKNVNDIIAENKSYNSNQLENIALKHKQKEKEEIKKEIKKPTEVKRVQLDPAEVKNMIMREIIMKQDRNMLEQNKSLFTDNDIKYLTEHLSKKKK